jgi:hypothetical protein
MPGLWAAVRRWGAVARRVVLPMVTAAAVVAGSLWVAVTPGGGTTRLTSAVLWAPTLSDVRPDDSGSVDPRLAAAVDAILARRGRAVRINDVDLFLRDVSPGLRAGQRQLFTNLRTIGMAVTYRRAEPWVNYEAQRRFGPATGSFRVSMRYQIFGTHLAQAATDVGYTFTVRSGRLYLVDDDDLDEALGGGLQPWDFGPIKAVRRPGALVIVAPRETGLGTRLADTAVTVAKQVRKVWPGPLQRMPVIVAMTDPRVLTGSRPRPHADEPAALERMRSPSGRPVGGWVVVRPDARRELDGPRLAHALMHLAPVRLGDQAPRWLAEGLAEYAENQQLTLAGHGREVARRRASISKEALSGLTALPADEAFDSTDSTDSTDIGWLAVDLLVRQIGRTGVTDFYRQVASRGYNAEIRERLLLEYTGLTEQELAGSLRNQVG